MKELKFDLLVQKIIQETDKIPVRQPDLKSMTGRTI